jgi:hypothetical protein
LLRGSKISPDEGGDGDVPEPAPMKKSEIGEYGPGPRAPTARARQK